MTISIDTEKAFDQIQHLFMKKKNQQIKDRKELLQPDKRNLQKS